MAMTRGETITQERRSRLGLILCRRANNDTAKRLANTLVKAWFAELGIENCDCERLEREKGKDTMKTLTEIIRDLRSLQAAQRSGSPAKLRVVWKKSPAARTLAEVATRTERNQQQPAPPVRRVASILEQLAKKAESK